MHIYFNKSQLKRYKAACLPAEKPLTLSNDLLNSANTLAVTEVESMKPLYKTIVTLALFSIAMGFMESAVAIYLRAMYYPDGFAFPLMPMDANILKTELLREAATIIMLVATGLISGKTPVQKFTFFLFCFGVWDICYYLFLKLLLNWPASLLTWDILFLLPFPWTGPVLAPCLLSLTMILFTFMILYLTKKDVVIRISLMDYVWMAAACLIIIYSFTADYIHIISQIPESASVENILDRLSVYIPETYNWYLFATGETLLLTDFAMIYKRSSAETKHQQLPKDK